jgi:SAM-dependent methyltransferase
MCPICTSSKSWLIKYKKDGINIQEDKFKNYSWKLCKQCGNAYPIPAPELSDLQKYWDQNRIETSIGEITQEIWNKRQSQDQIWAERTFKFVQPFVSNKKKEYLDIACGLGANVKLFSEKGWRAVGIDADPNTKKFHDLLGIQSTIGQIEQIEVKKLYDLISISHAIYFITEPRKFIQEVKNKLADKGLFLVVLSDFFSNFSDGQPGFAHTWYPTSFSMEYALEQEGFLIISRKKIRGSVLILARKDNGKAFSNIRTNPSLSYFLHLTQSVRYKLIGRPILWAVRNIKYIVKAIS